MTDQPSNSDAQRPAEVETLRAELSRLKDDRKAEVEALRAELAQLKDDRKADERASVLLEALLRDVPHYVYFKDNDRRFVVASDAFCSLFGVQLDEIIGKRDEDLFPPEIAEETIRDDLMVIETGAPLINKVEGGEDMGESGHWVLTSKLPWRDSEANVIGLFGISKDITKLRLAERELLASHAKTKALLEAMPDLMFRIAREGRFLDYHASRPIELWKTPEEFLGAQLEDVLPSAVAEQVTARVAQTLETAQPQTFEYTLDWGDEPKRHFEARMVASGQDEVLVIVRNTTERHQAEMQRRALEAQLQHAQKLESLGVLAGGIAHDFNNLLTSILGGIDLAQLDIHSGSAVTRHIELAREATLRAAELTEQMLTYSGKTERAVAPVALSQLVESTARLFTASVSKRAALNLDVPSDVPLVEADATQLRQVVMNLVINASEALVNMPGVVTVACGAVNIPEHRPANEYLPDGLDAGCYAFVEVTDTGCGMDQKTRDRMFDPFFTTKVSGRGLGMSVVLGIVRGHGGALTIESGPGRGTSIRVLIPAMTEPAERKSDERTNNREWRGYGRALLVEDQALVRETVKAMLEHLGFEPLIAPSGHEGVQLFRELGAEVSVVLMDLNMPEMSGPEAFEEIRALRTDVPIVFMSGYPEDLDASMEGGQNVAFIQKPYTIARLIETLREVLPER